MHLFFKSQILNSLSVSTIIIYYDGAGFDQELDTLKWTSIKRFVNILFNFHKGDVEKR